MHIMHRDNVVEAHCYAHQYSRIDCEHIRSRINQQLVAGRFGHEGLRQQSTKLKDTQCEIYFIAKVYAW